MENTIVSEVQPNQAPPPEAPAPNADDAGKVPERVLRDLERHKREAQEAKDRIAQLEKESLKSKEQYKELYEREMNEKETFKLENERIKQSIVNERKLSVLKSEAQALGLRPDALDAFEQLAVLDDVLVEVTQSTNGSTKVAIMNAKQVAEKMKLEKPFLFSSKNPSNLNTNTPNVVNSGEVSMDDIRAAESAWKKNPKDITLQSKYLELMRRFQTKG